MLSTVAYATHDMQPPWFRTGERYSLSVVSLEGRDNSPRMLFKSSIVALPGNLLLMQLSNSCDVATRPGHLSAMSSKRSISSVMSFAFLKSVSEICGPPNPGLVGLGAGAGEVDGTAGDAEGDGAVATASKLCS